MKPPWWMSGVKFSCQSGCGKCCDQPGGIVYLSTKDAERISNHSGLSVDDWLERDARKTYDGRFILKSREDDGICIHLDENQQCSIYEVRPQQCKAFPWWGENLASDRSWSQVKELCPGIDAEDALVVEGNIIRLHVFSDRESTKGFREWPPQARERKR
ncbi:MAG: zinc/iron-chelating domain-containing protein [Euryarchaeota archaeon]|nr:zinc/iron-chelating domain-containing protein [Euryarchaeota archaeon]